MEITRRNLFRAAAVAGGAAALGSLGGLAAEAVTGTGGRGRTTLDRVLLKGPRRKGGWRPVVAGPGEPHVVRSELAAAGAGRAATRETLLAFVQLSDVHILDAQSPLRFESAEDVSSSAYRPQEILTAQIAEAMVRELNQVAAGPVSGAPLALAIQTGDNSDNSQYNEIRWNIDILDGGTVTPDSGDLERYEGVMDGSRAYYDTRFWHPHGTPRGKRADDYRREHGFPVVPGLLDHCRRPFAARGLDIPWYTALGNHDELVQGNFRHTDTSRARAIGDQKPVSVGGVRTVTADPDRRLLSRLETVQEHFTTTGLPEGHGFTQENLDNGTAFYTFDQGLVRFVVMDTVNEHGGDDGSLDQAQFDWLKQQLTATTDHLVVLASHHSSWTMDNGNQGTGAPRVLGEAVVAELLTHENVVAWINGHTHRNRVVPHRRTEGGGFWEINTAAHIDWPQQSRILEVMDNQDGTLSIFTTMVDHGAGLRPGTTLDGTMKLAALGRLLAANDPQERGDKRRGRRNDRNIELLLTAPAWLAG
jgi:hypothetical protein